MQAIGHECMARVTTSHVVAELIAHPGKSEPGVVYNEPQHIVALQQRQPSYSCQGRFRLPNMRSDFHSIGRLMVVPAGVPLEISTSERPDVVVRCLVAKEIFKEYGEESELLESRVLSSLLNFKHREVEEILNMLGEELRAPGFGSSAMVESLGMALLIQLARYTRQYPKDAPVHRGGLSRRHLNAITAVVEGQRHCPSLSELSVLTGVSLRHLTRSFKVSTGMTVYAYVEKVRLEKARALLADSSLLVKDVADRLGFACASSFSVAFRKLAGETPHHYRKRIRRDSVKVRGAFSTH
jgi:AraC family transcriptional regulator